MYNHTYALKKQFQNSWGLRLRPPFSRPSASIMSAFGLPDDPPQMGPRAPNVPPQMGPKWAPTNGFLFSQNPTFIFVSRRSRAFAIPQIFWRPYLDSPDRVSMKVSIFSPDGKNFCQFMTPNVPKPRFLALCRGWGPGTHLGGRVGGPGTHLGGRVGPGGRRPTLWRPKAD